LRDNGGVGVLRDECLLAGLSIGSTGPSFATQDVTRQQISRAHAPVGVPSRSRSSIRAFAQLLRIAKCKTDARDECHSSAFAPQASTAKKNRIVLQLHVTGEPV